jgi:hypothetical protein
MKTALLAVLAISLGVAAGFWIAPPFGTFAVLAKSVPK